VKDFMVAPAAARQDAPLVALIADRDAETRRIYAEFLALSDCRIEQAEDGREALAKVFSRQPDVVVTETHLPGINGFELCALLRQDTATRSIPIVLVTGESVDIDVERAETAGADAVLTKPCPPATLFTAISPSTPPATAFSAHFRSVTSCTSTNSAGRPPNVKRFEVISTLMTVPSFFRCRHSPAEPVPDVSAVM